MRFRSISTLLLILFSVSTISVESAQAALFRTKQQKAYDQRYEKAQAEIDAQVKKMFEEKKWVKADPVKNQNTQNVLDEIIARLKAAQIEYLAQNPKNLPVKSSFAEITILESPEINNACVLTPRPEEMVELQRLAKGAGYSRLKSRVYITTGTIHDLVKHPEKIEKLQAILSHEMAHPLDYVSANSVATRERGFYQIAMNKTYGNDAAARQARSLDFHLNLQTGELRADGEGTELMKLAHFNSYGMLELMEDQLGNAGNMLKSDLTQNVGSGLGTHPENELRKAFNRIYHTFNRYENGSTVAVPLKNSFQASDLAELKPGEVATLPLNTSKMRTELDAVLSDAENFAAHWKQNERFRTTENAIKYSYLDRNLSEILIQNPQLSAKQKERLIALAESRLSESSSPANLIRSYREVAVPSILESIPEPFVKEKLTVRHREFLNRIEFYRSREYIDGVTALTNSKDYYRASIASFADVYPKEELYEGYRRNKVVTTMAEHLEKREYDRRFNYVKDVLGPMEPSERSRYLADDLTRKLVPGSALDLSKLFFGSEGTDLFPLLNWEGAKGVARTDLSELAQVVWKNREKFAISELFLPADKRIEWNVLFDQMGIKREDGMKQLKASVQKFVAGSEFKTYVNGMKDWVASSDSKKLTGAKLTKAAASKELKTPLWIDEQTLSAFDRLPNSNVGDRIQQDVAKRLFKTRAYQRAPDLYRKQMSARFNEIMSKQDLSTVTKDNIDAVARSVHAELVGDMTRRPSYTPKILTLKPYDQISESEKAFYNSYTSWLQDSVNPDLPLLTDVKARWVDQSKLPLAEKQELLRKIAYYGWDNYNTKDLYTVDANTWLTDGNATNVHQILKKNGIEVSELKLDKWLPLGSRTQFFNTSSKVIQDILNRADTPEKIAALVGQLWPDTLQHALIKDPALVRVKDQLIAKIKEMSAPDSQKLKLFASLTRDGSSIEMDQYLIQHYAKSTSIPEMLEFSKTGYFSTERAAGDWADHYLDKRLLHAGDIQSHDLQPILNDINVIFPNASAAKDKMLEKLAWKHPTVSFDELDLIENLKIYRAALGADSTMVNGASLASSFFQTLDQKNIEKLIAHMNAHPGEALTPELTALFRQKMLEDATIIERAQTIYAALGANFKEVPKAIATPDLANMATDWMNQFMVNLKGTERLPIFDLLIHSGKSPLSNDPNYAVKLLREVNHVEKGSREEKLFSALMKSLPEHEQSVTLSYLLSQGAGNGEIPVEAFEMWGTPGKKFAQMAATFDLFGPKFSERLQYYKFNAEPMTKKNFLSILKDEMSEAEFGKIGKVKRILGAASLKTVAEVELTNGRTVVISVINPKAAAQNATHIEFGRRFIDELEKEGLLDDAHTAKSLVNSLERQLQFETDARYEAKNMAKLQAAVERTNARLAKNGFAHRIQVPKLEAGFTTRPHVLVMEKAPGEIFSDLRNSHPELAASAGETLVSGSADLLFNEGYWDADRHVGNAFVDPKTGNLTLIDVAQTEHYSKSLSFLPDERTNVAEFMVALSKKDPVYLARITRAMSQNTEYSKEQMDSLIAEYGELFAKSEKSNASDLVLNIFKSMNKQGVVLQDKYSVGIVKGLVTLSAENYVTPEVFEKTFKNSVTNFLEKKKPWMLWSTLQTEKMRDPGVSAINCFQRSLQALVPVP